MDWLGCTINLWYRSGWGCAKPCTGCGGNGKEAERFRNGKDKTDRCVYELGKKSGCDIDGETEKVAGGNACDDVGGRRTGNGGDFAADSVY